MASKRYNFRWVAVSPDIRGCAMGYIEVEAFDDVSAKVIAEATVKQNGSIDWMLEISDNVDVVATLEEGETHVG